MKKHLLTVGTHDFTSRDTCVKFARAVMWAVGGNKLGITKTKKGWRFKVYYVDKARE